MEKDADSRDLTLERFRPYLLLLVRSHMDRQYQAKLDPSDVVQQTLLEAHRKWHQFRGATEAELAAWLRRMLACELADALRGLGRAKRDLHKERALEEMFGQVSSRLEGWRAADQSSPSERAVHNEQVLRLAAALLHLPDDQRRAVELKHLEGQSVAQIAAAIGKTETAVGGLLRRGMMRLRELMNSNESRS